MESLLVSVCSMAMNPQTTERNKTMTRKILLALVCGMVLVASVAWVAPGWTATVSGTVTDTEGQAVVGAEVTFTDEVDPNRTFRDITDVEGRYELSWVVTAVTETPEAQPNRFQLLQNYPNPFNPSTVLPYTLAKRTEVDLSIYNILGQRVRILVQGVQDAGSYAATWDGRDDQGAGLAVGVYLCVLRCSGFVQVRKMVMMDGAAGEPAAQGPTQISKRSAGPEEIWLYTAKVSGEDMLPFIQRHVPISEGSVLDFVVDIYVQVQGTVSLPEESPVTPSELEMVSFVESSPVEASGEYAAEVVKTEKPQVVAYVKDGKPILLGYLFPTGTVFPMDKTAGERVFPLGKAVIGTAEGTVADARTTALALAMMSPLLVFSSGEQRTELAQAVVSQPEFLDLVSHIEEVLRTEPEKVLDGEAHPEIYTQAAQVLVAAIEHLGPQGKPSLVQGRELPWVEDRPGARLALINPQSIYYGTGIYGYETEDKRDVFLLPPKDGIVDFHWGLNFITWAEDTETERTLADGKYTFTIYKGIVNDFPIADLITWSHPAGRATIANVGTAFLDILDIIIGIKVHPQFSGLHLDIGGIAGLTEHMLAGDVVAVLGDVGSLLLANMDNIGLWLWEGAVKDSQRQLLKMLMPVFRNVAWPLKVLNVVPKIPFYYDLVSAPRKVRYTYAIREGIIDPMEVGEMALIPAGSFRMGDDEGSIDERPGHTVYVDAFYMDVCEVTNAHYKAFCDATGHAHPPTSGSEWYDHVPTSYLTDYPTYPVACVSWYDAVRYCSWRSRQEGLDECYNEDTWECDFTKKGYRLPTEAEWEKATRGSLEGKRYPWGNEDPYGRANYGADNNIGEYRSDMIDFGYKNKRGPTPIGSYDPNVYGLSDMAGNLWEWCNDWYDSGYYSKSPENNPTGSETGSYRVVRGGSWLYDPGDFQCAERLSKNPSVTYNIFGFRCVRSSP